MIKYVLEDTMVVFREIPDEITLAINISNCQNRCVGCHSPYLREDIGDELTESALDDLIALNDGISCVCFMGEGNDRDALLKLALYIKTNHKGLKTGVYSGREEVEEEFYLYFNYVKVGPYIPGKKALNFKTTNQRLYEIVAHTDDNTVVKNDITYKFWKNDM